MLHSMLFSLASQGSAFAPKWGTSMQQWERGTMPPIHDLLVQSVHLRIYSLVAVLGFEVLSHLDRGFLSSNGSLVFGKQADLCQVRCALDNKFLRVNGFMISPEDNLMSL